MMAYTCNKQEDRMAFIRARSLLMRLTYAKHNEIDEDRTMKRRPLKDYLPDVYAGDSKDS
jgi:hypothetical protein